MSLRFYADSSMTSFREFTLTELFDPRINRVWELSQKVTHEFDSYHLLKADDYIKAIKGLSGYYIKYPFQSFSGMGDYIVPQPGNPFVRDFITPIPEELRWVLFFANFRGYRATSNKATLEFPIFRTEPSNYFQWHYIDHIDYRRRECTPEQLISFLNEIATHYDQVFRNASGKTLCFPAMMNPNGKFQNWFHRFLFGGLSYRGTGGYVAQESIFNIGPETQLTCQYTEAQLNAGHWDYFRIVQRISKTYRDPLYNILSYSAAATDLISWPIVESHEKNPILYGVELETASHYDIKEIIDAQAVPFFIAKQDSSISGNGGTKSELVTVPMSLKAHKKHWAHWFKNIDYDKFDCTKDTSNGMHVHIDRKAFMNQQHLQNMVWFYTHPANTPFLVYISERGSLEKMSRYSPIIQYPVAYSKIQSYKNCVSLARSQRGIVNLGKEPTIEVRMFRGIVSFGELVKNLEFVDAVFHFTEGEHSVNKLLFPDFLVWLSKQPTNRYTTLRKFIDLCNNLSDMITAAEVRNIVFNITDPMAVAKKLNESKLRVTNAHISVLNRGQKRKYTLNKETGLVDVTLNNRSKFFKMDRDIEARYTRHAIA